MRARFWVSKLEHRGGVVTGVQLKAVVEPLSPEYEEFFGGQIDMSIHDDVAEQLFEYRKEYWVEFTPVVTVETPDAD